MRLALFFRSTVLLARSSNREDELEDYHHHLPSNEIGKIGRGSLRFVACDAIAIDILCNT